MSSGDARLRIRLTFDVIPLRFFCRAGREFHLNANLLRGGFGKSLRMYDPLVYDRLFEPKRPDGPSGLKDLPRPFVFRVEERLVKSGEVFDFRVHLFGFSEWIGVIQRAFARIAEIERVEGGQPMRLSMEPCRNVRSVRITFLTPTELKAPDRTVRGRCPDRPCSINSVNSGNQGIAGGPGDAPPTFAVLFGRARDRISTLRSAYQDGPLDIDFKSMGERAKLIRTTRWDIRRSRAERTSRRTGQTHSLGGFTGVVEYEGDLGEFLPYLEIARWTGVGRQTVWGKGEIVCETF